MDWVPIPKDVERCRKGAGRWPDQMDIDSRDFLNAIIEIHEQTGVDVPEVDARSSSRWMALSSTWWGTHEPALRAERSAKRGPTTVYVGTRIRESGS